MNFKSWSVTLFKHMKERRDTRITSTASGEKENSVETLTLVNCVSSSNSAVTAPFQTTVYLSQHHMNLLLQNILLSAL